MKLHRRLLAALLAVAGCGPALVEQGVSPGPAVVPVQALPASYQPPTDLQNIPQVPASSAVSLPSRKEQATYHEVRPGESLSVIARRYGTTAADLIEANGLEPSAVIQPGQLLYIPPLESKL